MVVISIKSLVIPSHDHIVPFSFLLAYICHLTVYINCKILLAFSSSRSCSSSRYYTKSFNTCTAHVIIWLNFFSWICSCHPPLSDICCLLCTVLPPHPLWMYLLLVLFDICTITSAPALFGHNLILYNMSRTHLIGIYHWSLLLHARCTNTSVVVCHFFNVLLWEYYFPPHHPHPTFAGHVVKQSRVSHLA